LQIDASVSYLITGVKSAIAVALQICTNNILLQYDRQRHRKIRRLADNKYWKTYKAAQEVYV
jgi:hypothetical protein